MLADYLETLAETRLFENFTVAEIKKFLNLGSWNIKK